jgi:hypothetical protein
MFTIHADPQQFQITDISARVSANAGKLETSGNFSPARLNGKFEYNLVQNLDNRHAGKLTINSITPVDLDTKDGKLSQLLQPWPYPFDLLSGNIDLHSRATWSQTGNFSLITAIRLADTGGYFNELVFSGLTFDHELEILPKIQSIHKSALTLSHLDSGVAINNIRADIEFLPAGGTLPRIEVNGLHGKLFGGSFSADDFIFNPDSKVNDLHIKASDLDLAEIVKTQHLKDISATGRINGYLPVEINESGILIKDGAFVNDIQHGTIRYNPSSVSDQLKHNPLTGIALDALRDFRYTDLSAMVNFTADGTLSVKLKLKGTSPELDSKRPVHLNINTEQNLISLLKSLRFSEGLSDKIDKKVRRLYETNTHDNKHK